MSCGITASLFVFSVVAVIRQSDDETRATKDLDSIPAIYFGFAGRSEIVARDRGSRV